MMAEELIGSVTHYFAKPQVGVVKLTASVKARDTLAFRGHGAGFQQTIGSMQVDHIPVEAAAATTEVAIKVDQRVRTGTEVYRVTP